MKERRHKTPIINLTVQVSDGIPKCPMCSRPYEAVIPMIGKLGVGVAFVHEKSESVEFHYESGVLSNDDVDVDFDASCVWEIT